MSEGVDILGNANLTTPGGIILGVLIFIANQYFRNRAEKRTDAQAVRGSESGIVESTKATLVVVREQIDEMREDARLDKAESRRTIAELQRRIDEQDKALERLENENREYRRQLGFPPRFDPGPATEPYQNGSPASGQESGGTGDGSGRRRHRYRDEG